MFHKTKNKNKKWFCRSCLQCFSSESVLIKHKENCWRINFECNLRDVESYEGSYTKKQQDHIPCSFAYKVVCVDDRFIERIVVYRGENSAYEFIKAVLKEYKYCKKVMNKHFNKI